MEKADVQQQGQTKEKPKISPLRNGPLYLLNNMELKVVENLQNYKREPLSTVRGVSLCRCGASNNKPFCDGTHIAVGFSSENKTAADDNNSNDNDNDSNKREHLIKDKRKNYVGKEITIHDNRRICSHAAECVNNLSSVFKFNSRPWINPDSARVNEITNTIRKCPSGALSYSINDIEYRDPDEREPMVTVSKDGPYLITGGIDLIGDNNPWAEGASREHYTLCRCGASNYKPFCDGMHRTVNFKDEDTETN